MGNPKLETKKDVEYKDCAKRIMNSRWGVDIMDLYEPTYFLDWFIASPLAILEFKARYHHSGKYKHNGVPTIILSLHKYNKMMEFHRNTGGSGIFVVWCADQLMYSKIVPNEQIMPVLPVITWGGRVDREKDGIKGDKEPVLHIPVDKFKTVHIGGHANEILLQGEHKPQKT